MALKATLITGRSLRQGVGKEAGKMSPRYLESVGVCEMHPEDLREAGISPGSVVKVKTEYGRVLVKAVASNQIATPKLIFIPYGPYASQVLPAETSGSGMPTYKGVPAEVEVVPEGRVLALKELVKESYGR